MNDFILVIASYTAIIFLSFGIIAFLQAGFLMPFLKVKTSRGKKILLRILKPTGVDFIAADIFEGALTFKYKKEKKKVSKFEDGLYRSWNVNCVDVDGKTYGIVTKDFENVSTNDPTKTDHLIERALMRPDKKITKESIIIFMLLVALLLLMFIAYKLNFVAANVTPIGVITGVNL